MTYNETPGNLVVFVRINPHTYKTKNGEKKLIREERLKLLIDTFNYITEHVDDLKKKALLQVFYLCYSADNKVLARHIPKKLIYCKDDLK